ncbi:MAG: hypothetical protein N2049_07855 [Anaerolineales bacterium]|nr:hypothetical protein [Anaerolineales bacterium]MCX7609113.1 hypothetical protein [Anaerolineales bacterium]MDW8227087.1 hypothetical protein [Anaerolineales bacterium]
MQRSLKFLLFLALGLSLGLLYGWVIDPVRYVDISPDFLRADYRADYVLMIAEIYAVEHNLQAAAGLLSLLAPQTPPAEIAAQALEYARSVGYDPRDLLLLEALVGSLRVHSGGLP